MLVIRLSSSLLMNQQLAMADCLLMTQYTGNQFDKCFRCVCGLMKKKTRILVTHQLQFLPEVDRVFVLHMVCLDDIHDALTVMITLQEMN